VAGRGAFRFLSSVLYPVLAAGHILVPARLPGLLVLVLVLVLVLAGRAHTPVGKGRRKSLTFFSVSQNGLFSSLFDEQKKVFRHATSG